MRFHYFQLTLVLLTPLWYVVGAQEDPLAHIHYYFYPDPSDPSHRIEIKVQDPTSLEKAQIVKGQGAKFIVHGHSGSCLKNDFPLPTISAYLQAKLDGESTSNIFCIEYTDFTTQGNNFVPRGPLEGSRFTINTVAKQTSRLMTKLVDQGYISDLKDVHIIGHSMGAHVSGGIGYRVRQATNYTRKVGRISGVDPGNPIGIDELDMDIQLDPCDASFVDAIHTDDGRLGQKGKIGQVDFYPDGGASQKMCRGLALPETLLEMSIGGCSHVIVGKYWARSVKHRNLIACQASSWKEYERKRDEGRCDNPIVFGDGTPPDAHGRYYLDYPQSPKLL